MIERILERLALVSKEKGRAWVDELAAEEDVDRKEKVPEDDDNKVIIKKKGIGYGSEGSGNKSWHPKDEAAKRLESEKIQDLISLLEKIFDGDWSPPAEMQRTLCESVVFPMMENSLRGGSLLDISKDIDLFIGYLRLAKVLARVKGLSACLRPLDRHYQPAQTESIFELLKKLNDVSNVFMNCMEQSKKGSEEESRQSFQVASQIIEAFQDIEDSLKMGVD